MRHAYLALYFMASLLLLVSCSGRETFFFSNAAGSYSSTHKAGGPEHAAVPSSLVEDNATGIDTLLLATVTENNTVPLEATLPIPVQSPGMKLISPPPTHVEPFVKLPVKAKRFQKGFSAATQQDTPAGIKPVNRQAKIGLIISMAAVGLTVLATAVPAVILFIPGLIAAIAGTIISGRGLSIIKNNPEQYTGKGKAQAGFFIGLALIAFYTVAIAGAIALANFFSDLQ